jgi:VanZ family protein
MRGDSALGSPHRIPGSGWSSMPQHDGSSSRRHRFAAQFAALGRASQDWRSRWLAAVWLAAVIAAVTLSVLPGSWVSLTRRGLPDAVGDVIEPLSHFLGYAILVGFASMAFDSFAKLMLVFVAAVALSGGLEVVQLLVPERGASLADLSMNVLGATVGCLFGAARLRRNRRIPARGQSG